MDDSRTFEITERSEIPWLSIALGYGPMLPFAMGALAAWVLGGALSAALAELTIVWAASILAFLAGVRRGLSFRTEGGPKPSQIVTMFCFYVLAFSALVACSYHFIILATALVLVGFVAMFVLDPIAARAGEAPLFFARLRPSQLTIAVVSLTALLIELAVR